MSRASWVFPLRRNSVQLSVASLAAYLIIQLPRPLALLAGIAEAVPLGFALQEPSLPYSLPSR